MASDFILSLAGVPQLLRAVRTQALALQLGATSLAGRSSLGLDFPIQAGRRPALLSGGLS